MADMMADIMNAVSSYKAGSEAAAQQMSALSNNQADLEKANTLLYGQEATDNSVIAAAKGAAELQTQANKVAAANAFYTNMGDVNEQITKFARAAQTAQAAKDAALASIAEKDSVSLFDNPIKYIVNQFTINGDIAKHNAANAQLESANTAIQTMNANTQTTAITQAAISAPLTQAAVEAATRNAAVKAASEANSATIKGLGYNIQGIQAALSAPKEALQTMFQVLGAQQGQQQIALHQQGLALQQSEFKARMEDRQKANLKEDEQRQMDMNMIAQIERGRKIAMKDTYTPMDSINAKAVISAFKGKGAFSGQMLAYYDAGERSQAAGIDTMGATPAQALNNISAIPSFKFTQAQAPLKDVLAQSAMEVREAIMNPTLPGAKNANLALQNIDPKDRASIDTAVNKIVAQKIAAYAAEVKPGDASNPNQIGSVNALGSASTTIQKLPLYQKVFAPLIKNGDQLAEPDKMFQRTAAAVANGTITHEEALGLSTIIHVGVAANIASRGFQSLGIAPSYTYNTRLTTNPDGFNATEVVDLAKPDALSRALLKLKAAELQSRYNGGILKPGLDAMEAIMPSRDSNLRSGLKNTNLYGPSATFITDPNDPRLKTSQGK